MSPPQIRLHTGAPPPHFSNVPSSANVFSSPSVHRAWLATQGTLPAGFRVGTTRFAFTPREVSKPAEMTLTLIVLDRPSPDFAAVFTRNAFPGAPVIIGRRRLAEPVLGAILINTKISNVCAPGGVQTVRASRHDREAFRAARKASWGGAWGVTPEA